MSRVTTFEELKAHGTKDSLYILLHEKVYDVTKFIDEHPGGDEVILSEAGKDATDAFEDVGHSDEARDLLPGMLIGEFEKNSELQLSSSTPTANPAVHDAVEKGSNMMYFLPLGLLGAYFAWRFYGGA
ncbi:cytochrome b5-like heme/steroid binding domain-containing protein [Scleroderma yunnanense]